MGIEAVISLRRSIREYTNEGIDKDTILQCIEAARLSPSACNAQPWKYIVINDPAFKEEFCKQAFSGIYSNTMFAAKAPVIVAIVADKPNLTSWIGNKIQQTSFELTDVGISCAHFVLRAKDLGLGTCIIGWFSHEKAAKALKLPKNKKIILLVSLGHPAQDPAPRPRKKIEEMCSFNEYK